MLLEQPLPYRPFELADRLSRKELLIYVVSKSPFLGQLLQISSLNQALLQTARALESLRGLSTVT